MFSQGAEIKKPRAISERIKPGLSMGPLFLCAGPRSTARGDLARECMWTGHGVGRSLWPAMSRSGLAGHLGKSRSSPPPCAQPLCASLR